MIPFLLLIALVQPPLIIPRPALPGPQMSIFSKIRSPAAIVIPSILNLISKKTVIISRERFNQVKELKTFAFQSPLSFLHLQQNAVVLLLILKGTSPAQVTSMSVFCLNRAIYSGPFARQIILPLDGNYPNNTKCLVVLELVGEKGLSSIPTLQSEFTLPKANEI